MLLADTVDAVIADIAAAVGRKRWSAATRKPDDTALRYFRRNLGFLRCATYLADGLPIATGVIEGACRHLVQDRLGITGARWGVPGAEAMLRLRALHPGGDWHAHWEFHARLEAQRTYPTAA